MPTPVLTSNYNGEVYDYIIQEAVIGNEAVEKGSVNVIPDVTKKLSIAKMTSSANPIIDREAMPTTKSATVTWSEATLTPVEMMIFIPDINPRIYESAWKEFQPDGVLPDKVLDPNIQRILAEVVMRQARLQVGTLLWQGDTTLAASNPLHFFNGYITRALASATNIDVPNLGVITQANVIAVLASCETYVPAALYDDPDMIIHMSTTDFRKYQGAVRDLSFKGQGPAEIAPSYFMNREIRHYAGFPVNKILICRATTGSESNLYAAVEGKNDMENFQIAKLRPEGELYFLKALFKMDANFSIDSESVFYSGS